MMFLCCFVAACGSENQDYPLEIQGQLVKYSDCKGAVSVNELLVKSPQAVPNNVSQVDYFYDIEAHTLILKHVNSAFNCCPDNLDCQVSFEKGVIIIEERENVKDKCKCNCLYDLDILVVGVEPKQYSIKVIEPYYSGEQKIVFDVDLAKKSEGSFSATRNEYPWGESYL